MLEATLFWNIQASANAVRNSRLGAFKFAPFEAAGFPGLERQSP